MKNMIKLSLAAVLATPAIMANTTDADMQAQLDALTQKIEKLEKKQKKQNKKITEVKKMAAKDNIKFGVDFRNTVESISYKYNDYSVPSYTDSSGSQPAQDISGTTAGNPSLLTSRLYLTMAAAPMKGLIFKGKLAIYSTWGSHLYVDDAPLKDWSASSKPTDTVMRVKEAYFVYSNSIGEQPISFSIGRRPSSNGFLANYRENEDNAGSPAAHITNMEVNAAMVRLSWDRFISGAYTKFVYGRAHSGEMSNVYSAGGGVAYGPYALDSNSEDDSVDFFVMPGDAYNDGQYQIMYQWAHIFNTKGKNLTAAYPDNVKINAGTADLASLALKVDGIGEEISDFLDETMVFVSLAATTYDAKDGYTILGSGDGGTRNGYSYWIGTNFPDMMTDSGRFGLEYNHGSSGWTPMTWAEDTAIGSKVAVRGDAYEAYWNFDLFGVKYLPSQVRYTYVQHDYTPNVNCAGWVTPVAVDIEAQNLRFAVSYRY
ncbi:MAG: DUF3373 family protein [Campylobacterota bacterium]|nr:DUF3373 family protein [Campylobacterota bacterium]